MTDVGAIREILARRQPELLPLVDGLESGALDDDDVTDLQMVLADELLEFGFENEDETNDYGDKVELLIDLANGARPEFRGK